MARDWSRRHFLATLAAASTAPAFSRLALADESAKRFGPFKMGMQSYSLRNFPLDKALDTMQALGIETVEFFGAHYNPGSNDEQISTMNQKLADHKLVALAHGVNGFSKDHEANKRLFEFAKKAGVRNITCDPSEDSFDSLDQLVAEYDIRVAIHNHGPGARYDKVASVLNAVKNRHANIGACADLGHFIRTDEDPVRVINLLEGRLFGIHLKDFEAPRGNAKGCILGEGVLDVAAVFKALDKVKFPADACLALEYEENPNDPVAEIEKCLAAAEKGVKDGLG
jgi:sugar phosphate isomerase/epimerase